jgi:hypothetical protein
MDNKIKNNIETLYLIPFICNCKTINEASLFLEEKSNIIVKMSNFTKKINLLIKKDYLILLNNPSKTKYNMKQFTFNYDKILNDIMYILKNVTSKYTYTFKIDGRKVIKEKKFSYIDQCNDFENMLLNYENKKIFISLLSKYFEIVLLVNTKKSKITRKSEHFSYIILLENFIYGMALNKKSVNEYHSYIDEDEIMIFPNLLDHFNNNDLITFFKKLCVNYKLLKETNKNSFYAGLLVN